MRIRGILFDKDGTLFDFNATWGAWTLQLLTEEAGGDPLLLETLAAELGFDPEARRFRRDSLVIASTTAEVAEAILPHLPPQPISALIARLNARSMDVPQIEATPLGPFLQGLGAAGYRLGIATNDSEAPARAHLAAAGIEAAFHFIAGADSGHGWKPGPGQLFAFAEATDLAPEEVVMVGDSTHDLLAAQAAGMPAVGVLTGLATEADLAPLAAAVLPSIAALPAWLAARKA